MPIRTYQCPACSRPFELILNRKAYDATTNAICPKCGTPAPTIISIPARRNPKYGIQN
jgi:putative FmdB family regulatory protein